MASRLEAGVVWANTYNRFDPTSRSAAKASPGREGGLHGLEPVSTSRSRSSRVTRLPVRRPAVLFVGGDPAVESGGRTRPRGRTGRARRGRTFVVA